MDKGLHVPKPRSLIAQHEVVTLPLVAIEKTEAELWVKGLPQATHSTRQVKAAGAGTPGVGGVGAEAGYQ